MGYIPQVQSTYTYLEGQYGHVNSEGLGIGESTCGAVFKAAPASGGGAALLGVQELSRLAMERCGTARGAVALMGVLAEQYGFYGMDWEGEAGFKSSGESLQVTDGHEAWVFHVLPGGNELCCPVLSCLPSLSYPLSKIHFSQTALEPVMLIRFFFLLFCVCFFGCFLFFPFAFSVPLLSSIFF